jgi:8-oxo-dGTP pyrophosphatase MutT (NUDIX family)
LKSKQALNCDNDLRYSLGKKLDSFDRVSHSGEGYRAAAVALVIVDAGFGAEVSGMPCYSEWRADACLVLTRRSSKMRNHSGQWALPGGRVDEGESLEQTALRELEEEVGLELSADHVIGRLDDFVTRSGYVMTPVVVWGGATSDKNLLANEEEVASIHRIPLTEFMRDDAPLLDHQELETAHPVLRMPVGDTWIAAPTAALIFQFVEVCLRGRATRVAHYEQPKFAWK